MKRIIFFSLILLTSIISRAQDTPTEEWDDYFMPGVGYRNYFPKNDSLLGFYQGFMTEFVIYASTKGDNKYAHGPSRVKTYGNLSIMSSSNSEAKDIFFANVGLNLSFEGKAKRKYCIPYFGLEMGGLFQRDFSTMQFTPVAGIQLISTRTILWSAQGGYLYTTKKFDEYSGYSFGSTVNLLLWNR